MLLSRFATSALGRQAFVKCSTSASACAAAQGRVAPVLLSSSSSSNYCMFSTSTTDSDKEDDTTTTSSTSSYFSSSTSTSSSSRQRIVIAVGGNALQRRGERLTIENMLKAAAEMAPTITQMAKDCELVLTHGNGPQVGELALERSAATFDVLGAESMGQIGYVLAQALASAGCTAVPILTQVVVDDSPQNEAFQNPSKFVGPIYGAMEAQALAQSLGWTVKPDGEYFRRVVPSPEPLEIVQLDAVRLLLEAATANANSGQAPILPIACGGGGVPVARIPSNPKTLQGVEAVIDKDACGAKLATELQSDGYIILTDGGGIWENFGKPNAREMKMVTPEYLLGTKAGKAFPGSMGPKIQAAIDFVTSEDAKEGAWAAIGDLKDAAKISSGAEGTLVTQSDEVHSAGGVIWREGKTGPAKKPTKEPHRYG